MSLVAHILTISVLGCLPILSVDTAESAVFAAAQNSKKEASRPLTHARPSSRPAFAPESKGASTRSISKKAYREERPHLQASKPDPRALRKRYQKKTRPLATVLPKPDLAYHGILEHAGRYDPSLQRHKGAPHNPQVSELLHDHFQELDKNQDGVLDPLERAVGRLDMDRDLSNRQWD
jgi:hypothetical protein